MNRKGFAMIFGLIVGAAVLAAFIGIYLSKRVEDNQRLFSCREEFEKKVETLNQLTRGLNKLANGEYQKDVGVSSGIYDSGGNLLTSDEYVKKCLGSSEKP